MSQLINIVFESSDFVVCDKPAHVLSTPDRFKSDRPCLGLELQKEKKLQIFPVHRLDYEVSGLIIYAKNANAHKISQNWFEKKMINKTYQALTLEQDFTHWPSNIPAVKEILSFETGKEFLWKMKMTRGKRRSFETEHGDPSETYAQMLERNQNRILWRLKPITGRAHQLRLELSRHGFPILGDSLYGSREELSFDLWPHGGIALRAVEIEFNEEAAQNLRLPSKIKVNA